MSRQEVRIQLLRSNAMRKPNKKLYVSSVILFCMTAVACGGGTGHAQPEHASEESVHEEKAADTMTIEGSRGSLGWDEVKPVFEENMNSLFRCYENVLDDIGEFVSGTVELDFKVRTDGSVRDAFVSSSNLGSQRVHACLLHKLERFTFPEPHGGEAEVTYALDLELDMAGMDPEEWTMNEVAEHIGQVHEEIENCMEGRRGVSLTIYIDMGGRVIETGAASDSPDLLEPAECLCKAAMMWPFPDPGQKMAKNTLEF